jgi:hypothetical protein
MPPRPFSSDSIISPHAALAALGGGDGEHPYAPQGVVDVEAGPSRHRGALGPLDERDERGNGSGYGDQNEWGRAGAGVARGESPR